MFYLLSRGEPTPANLTHFKALHLALHLIPILLQIIKPPKIIFMKLDERLISAHHQFSPVHLEKQVLLKLQMLYIWRLSRLHCGKKKYKQEF